MRDLLECMLSLFYFTAEGNILIMKQVQILLHAVVLFHVPFLKTLNRTFCKETVKNLDLIWVLTVCPITTQG